MSGQKTAYIFPAFAEDFLNHPLTGNGEFLSIFNGLLKESLSTQAPEFVDYNFYQPIADELIIQYLTYIYGCAAGDFIKKSGLQADYHAGYSMGIYAALYATGSISLHVGIELIRNAYSAMKNSMTELEYGMGITIGLTMEDVNQLIERDVVDIEITNQNAPFSFVISGLKKDVSFLLELAKEEGAMHVRALPVSLPYHSGRLKEAAVRFGDSISHMQIKSAEVPLFSLIDQSIISSGSDIRRELTRNLHCSLNWYRTQLAMMNHGISFFIEVGAGKGLKKNSKFIEGDYTFHSLDQL